jgi:hypothetical protein
MEPTTSCQACGHDVPPGRFCALCGHSLTGPAASPAPVAAHEEATPNAPKWAPADSTHAATTILPVSAPTRAAMGTDGDASQELALGGDVAAPERAKRARLSNRNVGIIATTLALLAVAGYLVFGTGGESHTVTGQLALTTASDLSTGSSCEGTGGYSDISPGTQVVIEDETGSTLATSSFDAGSFDGVSCVFEFTFDDVPKAAFYRVHQSSDRGVLQYSYQDMVDSDWSVYLTLGDDVGQD